VEYAAREFSCQELFIWILISIEEKMAYTDMTSKKEEANQRLDSYKKKTTALSVIEVISNQDAP
jgi:hypothetical protein